jgi:8-amino-7-oxononanoate synthase
MSDPFAWIDAESAAWSRRGLERRLTSLEASAAGRIESDGRSLVNFASNDYLGLANDPRVVLAAVRAAERFGIGAGASPLMSGWRSPHLALAGALARFERTEAAVVFASGYSANVGTVAALVGSGDAIYSDRLNHACLIDGARLSGARIRIYPHSDATQLEAMLGEDRGQFRRSLIVTDGVFSMDGDLAPIADLVDLAERFEAMLLVDEAHGTGVFGPDGRGAASACGVAERVAVRVGTLSKALGAAGGFVAGPRRVVEWLVNHARPLIYSTAPPPAVAAAAMEALSIAESEPWRREHVLALGDQLRQSLADLGLSTRSTQGPIVPLIVGDPAAAISLASHLRQRGFLVPAIRPPTVPEGSSRLRVSLTAAHSQDDVTALVRAIRDG